MIFYHGTAATYLAAIQAKGLIPDAGRGADAFATERLHWSKEIRQALEKRTRGVYITPSRHIADWYARMTADLIASDPVILELDVPETELTKLRHDEAGDENPDPTTSRFGGRFEGTIPPAWIVGQAPLAINPDPLPTLTDAIVVGNTDLDEL